MATFLMAVLLPESIPIVLCRLDFMVRLGAAAGDSSSEIDKAHTLGEKEMLISFSALVLASQLITVADTVPNFNEERECKIDSAAAFDPNAGLNATIKRCTDDEQKAKGQLQTQWSQYAPSDKAMCIGLTTDDAATPPSYVELLTCLEGQQLVRKLPKD